MLANKTCDKCGTEKPLEDFPFFRKKSEGTQPTCRACDRKKKQAAYYERNKEASTARSLAWRRNNPEKASAARKAWRKANPEKMRKEDIRRRARMSLEERERRRTYDARYYAENRVRVLAQQREYLKKNAVRNRERALAWAEANPERAAARVRAWRKENPDLLRTMRRIYRQTRHARNKAAGVPEASHVASLLKETACIYCGEAFDPAVREKWLTIEHVVPLVLGGTNASENLFSACYACNRSKGGRLLKDWKKNPRPGWTPVRPVDKVFSLAGFSSLTSERERQAQ
jgi:5-methylcytosine-specific restriction endonuclease McrA